MDARGGKYCFVLHCIVLHCIILYYIVSYCIALYCITLYRIVLHCIVLYHIVLHCIVLYRIVPREKLTSGWEERLDDFQKLLVLRCLRSDKMTNGMQDFVANHLGQRFIEPQVR